jgi:hypothetical protein
VGRARTLAEVYRRFGEVDAAETSPLCERVAVALSESDEALRAIEAAPARKRHPTVILAALHDLALAGRAPALAAANAAADGDAAAGVTDADDARWVRACLWPDQPERVARLGAEMALAATAPPLLLQGDPVEALPDAFARVAEDALPVVTTTWSLSHFPFERRLRFLRRLDEAAAGRAVAWVSAEGVGAAPAIPTLGDRRASGHSIVGLAALDRSALRAEAIGRCWSQGRWLAWLADS